MSTTVTSTTQTEPITADNVLRLFPDVDTHLAASHRTSTSHAELEGYDEEQVRLMDEVCIVLDRDDQPIGSASKKTCHLMTNIRAGLLHRAFSVFLFDPDTHRLLLQQRADAKITFPSLWTNTCCSHPLGVPSETGNSLPAAIQGAKRAAQRKLGHELGIPAARVPPESFSFLTRIHYLAPSDGTWGEHEIDYILVAQRHVTLDPNPNEIRDTRWVTPDELRALLKDPSVHLTPWFRLICETSLFDWWAQLQKGELREQPDTAFHRDIQRM